MAIKFHAVMIDETGCEFGAEVEAPDRETARAKLRENYPESRVDQLESPEDTRERERAMYDHIARGGDWDPDWEDELDEWEWEPEGDDDE